MASKEYAYGVCGVFCEMCPSGTGKIAQLATDLLKLIKNSYTWAEDKVDFSFKDLRKGLEWLTKDSCPTCRQIEEPWCDVLKCEKAQKLKSCLLCEDFLKCESTEYHRDRYPFVIQNYERVKKVGLEEHLKEERKKAQDGVTLNDIRKW
jgi:hypothetical protein